MAKDETLRLRVTVEEKGIIEAAAQCDGVPVSAWMLGVMLDAAAPTFPPAPAPELVTVSRSQARRVAAQKGLPAPTFKGPASDHGPASQDLAHRAAAARGTSKEGAPAHPVRCSRHKRLGCPEPACAPVSPSA